MADYTVSPENPAGRQPPLTATLAVYVLFAITAFGALLAHGLPLIAPVFGIAGVIGLIIAYVQRGDAAGTWVESHLRWLIRTFWWSLLWAAVGIVFAVTIVGLVVSLPIWIVDTIWVLYRVIRGVLLFKDSRPVPGM